MAMVGTKRLLSSQIHRISSLPLLSRATISKSSSSLSSSSSSSKKVADRIVKFSAIDHEGKKREVLGLSGQTLLRALCNSGLIDPESHRLDDIEACGAECEINIAQEWLERLPPLTHDEQFILKRSSRSRVLNKHSRLGCQVLLTHDMDGMVVAVPEPRPWDTA